MSLLIGRRCCLVFWRYRLKVSVHKKCLQDLRGLLQSLQENSRLVIYSFVPLLVQFVIHSQTYHISSLQTLRKAYRISRTVQRTYNLVRRLDASTNSLTVYHKLTRRDKHWVASKELLVRCPSH